MSRSRAVPFLLGVLAAVGIWAASASADTVSVPGIPDVPGSPTGGWSVAFGDAFGLPLKDGSMNVPTSGYDTRWEVNNADRATGNTNGLNSDELEVFNPSEVSVQSDGLHLTEAYTPNVTPCSYSGSGGCNYTGGIVSTGQSNANKTCSTNCTPSFHWKNGQGETWAFQIRAKYAPMYDGGTSGGNNESWWSTGATTTASWQNEIDLTEHWGWRQISAATGCASSGTCSFGSFGTSPTCSSACSWGAHVWMNNTSTGQHFAGDDSESKFCRCDPAAAFHDYTFVLYPDNHYEFYMDGAREVTVTPAAGLSFKQVWNNLILSYGLRDFKADDVTKVNPIPGFTTAGQTRDWTIRHIAVYEDGAHAGQDVQNGGLAPGTTIG